jgi:hypothetical protein
MIESELGILSKQCLDDLVSDAQTLRHGVKAWRRTRGEASPSQLAIQHIQQAAMRRHLADSIPGSALAGECLAQATLRRRSYAAVDSVQSKAGDGDHASHIKTSSKQLVAFG